METRVEAYVDGLTSRVAAIRRQHTPENEAIDAVWAALAEEEVGGASAVADDLYPAPTPLQRHQHIPRQRQRSRAPAPDRRSAPTSASSSLNHGSATASFEHVPVMSPIDEDAEVAKLGRSLLSRY